MTNPYQTLIEVAAGCRQNERYLQSDGCNWCTCVERGVVICTQKTCWDYIEQSSSSSEEDSAAVVTALRQRGPAEEELYRFARTCKRGDRLSRPVGCGLCFCEAPGVIRCTGKKCDKYQTPTYIDRNLKKESSDSKTKEYVGIKLKATVCQPEDEPIVEGCKKCVCIRTGVMICRRIPDCKSFDYFPKRVSKERPQCKDLIDGCKNCVCQPGGGMVCKRIPGCNLLDGAQSTTPMREINEK